MTRNEIMAARKRLWANGIESCEHLEVGLQETLEETTIGRCEICSQMVWRWLTSDVWQLEET
jgi:hypothetical protein